MARDPIERERVGMVRFRETVQRHITVLPGQLKGSRGFGGRDLPKDRSCRPPADAMLESQWRPAGSSSLVRNPNRFNALWRAASMICGSDGITPAPGGPADVRRESAVPIELPIRQLTVAAAARGIRCAITQRTSPIAASREESDD
jgi:hypothetical protein